MTWTKLSDTELDSPSLLTLPRGVRLMHVEAMVWSNRHGTDGKIPSHALRRLTDENDIAAAATMLVEIGSWATLDDGWLIIGFTDTQMSAEEVKKRSDQQKERTERWRRHNNHDHSLCNPRYCKQAVTRDDTQQERDTERVGNAPLSSPFLTRPVRAKGKEGQDGRAPSEPRAHPSFPHDMPVDFNPSPA